MFVAKTVK